MNPILFRFGDLAIPSFGVMLALGFLAALWLGSVRAPKFGRTTDDLLTWAPLIMAGGLVGAKLLYLMYYPVAFANDPIGVLLYPGGLVWYGGVAGAIIVMLVWCWRQQLHLLTLGDWLAPSTLLGLAFGRVGCFLSGCCFGAPCALPWAVLYPVGHPTHPLFVHPAPLYATGLAVLLMGSMLWLERAFPSWAAQRGSISSVFLIGYGAIRFGLEMVRGDVLQPVDGFALSASQIMSVMAMAVGVWLLNGTRQVQRGLQYRDS